MAEDIRVLNSDADAAPWAATYEEILGKGQTLVYTNVGRSMMPLLRQRRDILIIEPRPSGRLKKFDVPLYKRGKKYILHRIVDVTDTGYVIIGDNNTFYEYDVTDDMILGVLTGFVREGKHHTVTEKGYRLYSFLMVRGADVRIFFKRAVAFGEYGCS